MVAIFQPSDISSNKTWEGIGMQKAKDSNKKETPKRL